MTAVQWLYNKMYEHRGNITIEEYEQAKQMEKEQKIDMYNAGYEDATCNHINDAEQYYHQKYNYDSSRKS